MNDAYSRWSTGNRGRATSASEVVEVAGLNHAIGVWFGAGGQGVTLKLAWGPSNPSPWNLRFVFVVFLIFPSLSSFYVFFFSFYFWAVVFLSHSDIFRSWFWYVSVAFFLFFLFEISFSLFMLLLLSLLTPNNFFFKFSHLIYTCWVGQLNGNFFKGSLNNSS